MQTDHPQLQTVRHVLTHVHEFAHVSLYYEACSIICLSSGATCAKVAKTIDSGSGFFIEEETAEDEQQEKRVVEQPGNQK